MVYRSLIVSCPMYYVYLLYTDNVTSQEGYFD